jgi:hypothetical protein
MSNFDQMPRASTDSLLRCPERDTLGVPPPKGTVAPLASPRPMGLRSGPLVTGHRISRSPPMSVPAKVFEDRETPGKRRVEWFDDDGRCEREIFDGATTRGGRRYGTRCGRTDISEKCS